MKLSNTSISNIKIENIDFNNGHFRFYGISDGEIDTAYIEKTRTLISEEHEKIRKVLLEIPELHAYKPMANFILVKILKEGISSFDIFDFLIRRKLMVRDCASFKCLDGEYIRFCIMNPEDNERLLKGLKEFFK